MTLAAALDLLSGCTPDMTPRQYGAVFLDALRPLGAKSLWARSFRLTSRWTDPRVSGAYRTEDHVRIRQADWQGSETQKFSDMRCPLAEGAAVLGRPFFATHFAPPTSARHAPYWEAMGEFDVKDTLAVPYFGPNHTATALTIWFTGADFSPGESQAIKLAALIAMDHLRAPYKPERGTPLLTERERDCLSYVTEGLSDQQIAEKIGVSHHTAHAHVESAKLKLGAKTRAQAVARGVALMEIFLP